jgi:hypothetical protein
MADAHSDDKIFGSGFFKSKLAQPSSFLIVHTLQAGGKLAGTAKQLDS